MIDKKKKKVEKRDPSPVMVYVRRSSIRTTLRRSGSSISSPTPLIARDVEHRGGRSVFCSGAGRTHSARCVCRYRIDTHARTRVHYCYCLGAVRCAPTGSRSPCRSTRLRAGTADGGTRNHLAIHYLCVVRPRRGGRCGRTRADIRFFVGPPLTPAPDRRFSRYCLSVPRSAPGRPLRPPLERVNHRGYRTITIGRGDHTVMLLPRQTFFTRSGSAHVCCCCWWCT